MKSVKKIQSDMCDDRPFREKRILNEVIIIRFVLIFCLVLYHSFAPYGNAWTALTSELIYPYYWISKFSYSFFLGSFVFISGYLYAHADLIKGPQPFSVVIKKKGMRLILPSVIFSIIYLLIFGLKDGESIPQALYTIIEGRGHMWFLPMLFWLFLAMELIKRIRLKPSIIIFVVLLLSIGVIFPLPLRMNFACYYLIFFYLGYNTRSIFKRFLQTLGGGNVQVISLLVWLVMFVCVESIELYNSSHNLSQGPVVSKISTVLIIYGRITYTLAGSIFIYTMALKFINKYHFSISDRLVKISALCFGIYLYQQFILIYLYYHTDFVNNTGILAAPWLGFLITLFFSTVLSYLTMQTRLGRALIG